MKIALVTGSRSDRNALAMVEKALAADGYDVWCLPIGLDPSASNYEAAVVASESIRMVASHFNSRRTYMVVLHGDRHEILGAAVAANVMGVPIAHLGGGDLTEGSQDDCFRHAITKLSHLHFPTNQDAADRIVQMGEDPSCVHMVGDPGIDMVIATPTLDRSETFAAVGLATPARCLLVLFHPNTMYDPASELEALSDALERCDEAVVFIGPNADVGSDLIRKEWRRLAADHQNTVYHDNLPPKMFYSLMKWCDVMVGNSSAAFYEAPCFGIRVINVGDRQQGRLIPQTVETWPAKADAIAFGIRRALELAKIENKIRVPNDYGDGYAAERIVKVIGGITEPKSLLRKRFHHVGSPHQ